MFVVFIKSKKPSTLPPKMVEDQWGRGTYEWSRAEKFSTVEEANSFLTTIQCGPFKGYVYEVGEAFEPQPQKRGFDPADSGHVPGFGGHHELASRPGYVYKLSNGAMGCGQFIARSSV